jgi:hypothetical protein
MAEEKLNTEVSVEENGTAEPVNGKEEASEPSSTLEKDEDEGKKEEDEGKGDGFLLDDSLAFFFFVCLLLLVIIFSCFFVFASGIVRYLE